jgi:hypothetical protein
MHICHPRKTSVLYDFSIGGDLKITHYSTTFSSIYFFTDSGHSRETNDPLDYSMGGNLL